MKHKIRCSPPRCSRRPADADVVTDWNLRANELVVESKLGTPPAMRVMAITQAAVLHAVIASGGAAPALGRRGGRGEPRDAGQAHAGDAGCGRSHL